MTTEAGFLLGMVRDLATVLGNGRRGVNVRGVDHVLELKETGDGHSAPYEAWWRCTCPESWAGSAWVQTGYYTREPEPFEEGDMDALTNAWWWLHHVWPDRYAAHPSVIMAETIRSVWEERRRQTPRVSLGGA